MRDIRTFRPLRRSRSLTRRCRRLLHIVAIACVAGAACRIRAGDVTVFAAASLTDSLKQIAAHYQRQTGETVTFNFEASSILARQIQEGAPADIFFSADEAQMDRLAKGRLIDPATRVDLLGNALVVIAPADSHLQVNSPADLADDRVRQIALGDPKAVPAGVYAKEWLERLRLWRAVRPKVVPTENVRAALAAVASGNVDAGIVYKTDAAITRSVKIVYEVPPAAGPDIRYPAALVKGSDHSDEAKRFLKYLESNEAARVFKRFGFIVRERSLVGTLP
ncbi:MAG: molybdate ABC transporter substrate-binding protein [Limisphaerales bacterium]